MSNAIFNVPVPKNEPIKNYASGSEERKNLKEKVAQMRTEYKEIPMYIDGKEVFTDNHVKITPPYDHKHEIGHFCMGDGTHVQAAIDAALGAKERWENLPWQKRAAIFLKAADLIAGPYRAKINAATMLAQSKNAFQAEIDASCEFIDFLRFNAHYMQQIYSEQPESSTGIWNRLQHRPLEGFVFAITPFNFTAIAGNLPASAAMMGNTVVWKPSDTQVYSAQVIMEVLQEAGLPDGVINLIYVDGPTAGNIVFEHPDFAGLHFTGSTGVFQHLWKTIGNNIAKYKTYPRIVGETGGKDFVMVHRSANSKEVSTALIRGSFEFQGQKCSAASRAYIPSNLWAEIKEQLKEDLSKIRTGSPENFRNFVNAVIDEKSFDKIANYIDAAKEADGVEVMGGNYDKSDGYFIEPAILVVADSQYVTMCEEIFGPVLSIYVYEEDKYEETLDILDKTSPYALTGALFAKERYAIELGMYKLRNAAGNFYINDKPTGAVVGQQPFGGGRASGTNDKAGSILNLLRWVSPRTIKETFVPATDFEYPFMEVE